MNALQEYVQNTKPETLDSGAAAYLAALDTIAATAPEIAASIVKELEDQRRNLKLIASENYSSLATQLAMGNWLTDKYAEGYPRHRFYAGCDNVDAIESYAAQKARELFGAEHAYVQPHSGADANLIAYWSILSHRIQVPYLETKGQKTAAGLSESEWSELREQLGNQRLLGMDYYSGGHLTHGYRFNVSARMFEAHTYSVNRETGLLDYDEIETLAKQIKPLILLAGYSAYPRRINFRAMREIAEQVGAVFMVDMAHFAGLVAGGVFQGDENPIPFAHVVTTTTHKTLRGPRGGMILTTSEFADAVDQGCPLVIGGPLPHVLAAKGVAFTEALKPEFKMYSADIVENARVLSSALQEQGVPVATGGTDNHLLLADVRSFGLTGRQAEAAVRECNVTLNRNALPFDPNGPWYTSGLRLGTPAATTLGMKPEHMKTIAHAIADVLKGTKPKVIATGEQAGQMSKAAYEIAPQAKERAVSLVQSLLKQFPVYPELDIKLLKKHFIAP